MNLSPADLPKEGSNYDLPIAVGILVANDEMEIEPAVLDNAYFYGELGLDGSLKHSKGVLLAAMLAKEQGVKSIYVSVLCANEAAVVSSIAVYPVRELGVAEAPER